MAAPKFSRYYKAAPAVFTRFEGDWAIARSIFRGLAFKLERAADFGAMQDAQAIASNVRRGILNRWYEAYWEPLSEQRKEEKTDPRILVGEGERGGNYVDHIEAFHLGRGRYAAGIRGDENNPNVLKGLTHEFGSNPGIKHPVPARPHWRVELERYKARGVRRSSIADAMAKVLTGRKVPHGLKVDPTFPQWPRGTAPPNYRDDL